MPQQQCTNLELSQELKKLGYPQESLFKWHSKTDENGKLCHTSLEYFPGKCINEDIAAPTVAELGERLPDYFISMKRNWLADWKCFDGHGEKDTITELFFTADTEADARAKMLIYLLK